jgi:hypothetical protein
VDDEVDRLYALPLEEFVPERDALAKRLRGEKRREEADAVKALRKPSVAAWAVNQVLRARPDEQRALLEAGDALRGAQDDLLGGSGDAAAARVAGEAERKAVGELVAAARGLAREKGFLSEPVLDRVRETLHAASTDDDARAEVEAARVSREWRPASFGGLEGFAASPRARTARKQVREPRGRAREAHDRAREAGERGRARERAGPEERRARTRDAEERAQAAEQAADERRRERARKAEESGRERERRAQARERRMEAEAALREARAEQREAARRRRAAEAAVTAAERELGDLRADLEAAIDEERAAEERRAAAEEALSEARAG